MNRLGSSLLVAALSLSTVSLAAVAVAQGRPPSAPAKAPAPVPPAAAPTPPPAAAPTPPPAAAPTPPPAAGARPGTAAPAPKTPMPAVGSQRPDTGHNPPGQRPGQATPGGQEAAPSQPAKAVKVKPTLECTTTRMDGHKIKLPAPKVRLEQPIRCVLNAGPNTGGAGLTGVVRVTSGGKVRKSHEGPLAGAGNASMAQELTNDDDYESCSNFAIEAEVKDAAGKVVGKKAIKVKQFCPD